MIRINKLDNTLTRGMLKAEKKPKGVLHKSQWFIELSNRIKHLSYWQMVVSQLLTQVSYSEWLRIIAKRLYPLYAISISNVTHAFAKRCNAWKELRQAIAQSCKFRKRHLIVRAMAIELNGEYKQGKAIKQLIIIKKRRFLHSVLKHHFDQITISSLSKIQIPVDNEV